MGHQETIQDFIFLGYSMVTYGDLSSASRAFSEALRLKETVEPQKNPSP